MNKDILKKYARLLVHYSLELKPEDRLFISTTLLAEPLVREIYAEALEVGALVETDFKFEGQTKLFFEHANEFQLRQPGTLMEKAIKEFDAYLVIRAPYNLNEAADIDLEKKKLRSQALSPINKTYFERTADRSAPGALKRSLCQYPTQASAEAADMTLEEYAEFVFNACHLYADDPKGEWLKVREHQQHIKEYLDEVDHIRYRADHTDIEFSVAGRTWINSDGQTNMPSGEVFSGPVESFRFLVPTTSVRLP